MKDTLKASVISTRYDQLLAELGGDYVRFRWFRGPKIHEYLQTRFSLMAELDRRGRVNKTLEIGCGPGTWTNLLRKHCIELHAIDVSKEMVRHASASLEDGVKIRCADFLDDSVEFQDKFDAIYGIRVFEYFANKAKAIRKMSDMLKEGGTVCLVTKNPWYLPALLIRSIARMRFMRRTKWLPRWFAELTSTYADELHSGWVSQSVLSSMFENAGFGQVFAYPAVLGVFYSRLDFRILDPIYWFFDRLFVALHNRRMRPVISPWVESYLITGVKSVRQ